MRPVKKKKAVRKKQIEEIFEPKQQRLSERKIKEEIARLDDLFDERYAYAKAIFDLQGEDAKAAIWHMMDRMKIMAPAPTTILVDGQRVNVEPEILARMQEKNFMWIAVRLMVACAKWDIRIAGFVAPKGKCMDCLTKVRK